MTDLSNARGILVTRAGHARRLTLGATGPLNQFYHSDPAFTSSVGAYLPIMQRENALAAWHLVTNAQFGHALSYGATLVLGQTTSATLSSQAGLGPFSPTNTRTMVMPGIVGSKRVLYTLSGGAVRRVEAELTALNFTTWTATVVLSWGTVSSPLVSVSGESGIPGTVKVNIPRSTTTVTLPILGALWCGPHRIPLITSTPEEGSGAAASITSNYTETLLTVHEYRSFRTEVLLAERAQWASAMGGAPLGRSSSQRLADLNAFLSSLPSQVKACGARVYTSSGVRTFRPDALVAVSRSLAAQYGSDRCDEDCFVPGIGSFGVPHFNPALNGSVAGETDPFMMPAFHTPFADLADPVPSTQEFGSLSERESQSTLADPSVVSTAVSSLPNELTHRRNLIGMRRPSRVVEPGFLWGPVLLYRNGPAPVRWRRDGTLSEYRTGFSWVPHGTVGWGVGVIRIADVPEVPTVTSILMDARAIVTEDQSDLATLLGSSTLAEPTPSAPAGDDGNVNFI